MDAGRVVILNGASSTGKTSIVTAFRDLQAAGGRFWLTAGIDDVLGRVTHPWLDVGWPGPPGRHADLGMRIAERDGQRVVVVGSLLRRLIRLYHRNVANAAAAGIDVVVDEAVFDRATWEDWAAVLDGLDVRWVAVRCDIEEMNRRERERGDRPIGLAAAQLTTVHEHPSYDLELDTTTRSPADSAHLVADLVHDR